MIGRSFNSYRVTRKLGEGGMGEVYAAEHVSLGRQAAIKVLRPEFAANEEVIARFLSEARATATVRHPGLIDVYDFGQASDGALFQVMELLEGESLEQLITRARPVPPPLLIALARQVCDAMSAAHSAGVVHRDLNPSNIFVLRDSALSCGLRTKVLDFGIAKVTRPPAGLKTRAHMLMGTPEYMSPEQCRDAGVVDLRTDIYALGCVLFEMACGRVPFMSENAADVIADHLKTTPPTPRTFNPQLSQALDALILKAIAKEPEGRHQSMGELDLALSALQAEATAGAMPVAPKKGMVPIRPRYTVPEQAPRRATGQIKALADDGAPNNDATKVTRVSGAAPQFRQAFAASYESICKAAETELAGVIVAVVEGYGFPVATDFIPANDALVVGRHSECRVRLTAPEAALRQLAVLSTIEEGRGVVRVWDLNTQIPFRTEDGAPSAAVMADGPLFLTTGSYGLILLPKVDGALRLPPTAAQAYEALPARNFLNRREHERGPERRPEPVKRQPGKELTNVTHVAPLAMLNPGENVSNAWGELQLRTDEQKQRVLVSAERLAKGILLGRYERCGVLLAAQESISRVHLLLVRIGDDVVAIDTASTRGTYRGTESFSATWLEDQVSLVLGEDVRLAWKRLAASP